MPTTTVSLKPEYARYYPDPLNKNSESDEMHIEHHVLLTRATNVPSGISKAPNPRAQDIDKGIYKEIKQSLENVTDPTFHLKNKGITILAKRVDYSADKSTATLTMRDEDGIADGAHTYEIILKSQDEGTCPDNQYVKFEILTGVPKEMGPDIAGGLNTAVQVSEASLMNLKKDFEWVKETLNNSKFGDDISYEMNDQRAYDIREILGLLTIFNVNKFPYPQHPKEAYISKARCLELYKSDPDSFKMLKPILIDILMLHDYIHVQSRELWNKKMGGRAGGMVGLFTPKKARSNYPLIFMGIETEQKLYDGALYPMLGAMRFLVEQKPGEKVYSWKLGTFVKVKKFFDEIAPDLVATTYQASLIYGRKPNPIGKDQNHWDNMYKTVALNYLTKCSANNVQ